MMPVKSLKTSRSFLDEEEGRERHTQAYIQSTWGRQELESRKEPEHNRPVYQPKESGFCLFVMERMENHWRLLRGLTCTDVLSL